MTASTVFGIDISHHNETPAFGVYDFVFHKATQGAGFVDNTYAIRSKITRDMGIVTGVYHFMTMTEPPIDQVEHFASIADVQPGDIVALDFETDGTWKNFASTAPIVNIGTELVRRLEDRYPNNRVIVYCNRTDYAKGVRGRDGMWIASPGVTPTVPYVFWQYGGESSLDLDQGAFNTVDDLREWANMGDTEKYFNDTANSVVNPKTGEHQTVFDAIWAAQDNIQLQLDEIQAAVAQLQGLKGSFSITGSGSVG